MIFTNEQRLGAAILFAIALVAWFVVAIFSGPDSPDPAGPKKRSWQERKDSIRLADSLRYVQWTEEREQRYDSFRLADSLRRVEWTRLRQLRYDSFRIADSLWRDSVGWRYTKRVKIDTVIDLNHCDTTDLLLLRGIGSYTANQIIRYRDELGGYYSPLQLTDPPFSQCRLDTLLASFTADTAAIQRIHVNTCSVERLRKHPYLRFHQAKAIYTLRRERLRLRSVEDLRDIPELTNEDLDRITPYLNFD